MDPFHCGHFIHAVSISTMLVFAGFEQRRISQYFLTMRQILATCAFVASKVVQESRCTGEHATRIFGEYVAGLPTREL